MATYNRAKLGVIQSVLCLVDCGEEAITQDCETSTCDVLIGEVKLPQTPEFLFEDCALD